VPDSSDVSSFLHGNSWHQRFEDEILSVARSFVAKAKNLELEALTDGSTALRGHVAGETTELNFWQQGSQWNLDAHCSCEIGPFCHHAAALMLKAAKQRDISRLEGHGIQAAVDAALPQAQAPPVSAGPARPHVRQQARFELHVSRQGVDANSKLILQSLGQKNPEVWIFAEAWVNYNDHRFPLRAAMTNDWQSEITLADGSRAILDHDQAAENAAARALGDTGLSSLQSSSAWQFLIHLKTRKPKGATDRWFPDPSRMPTDLFWHQFRGEWIEKLESGGWTIIVDDNVGHQVHDADPSRWKSAFKARGGGWFDLSVGFEVDGEKHDLLPILAELLEANLAEDCLDRPDRSFIYAPLPNGDALKLPVGRVRQILEHLSLLIDPKFPGRTKLHAVDAASLMQQLAMEVPPELGEFSAKLKHFSGIEAVDIPPGLQATLRDYQLAGFRWMHFLARHGLHGILADDMGLGKTLQTLAHILHEKHSGHNQGKPALVVAPTSVVPNWLAEAKKFAPGLKVLILDGPNRRHYHRSIPHADLVLTSYALLHRDIDVLKSHAFHLAILDEAQHIKNPHAKVAQAACELNATHRLCLSGTPVENHLGELWSLMKFLIPGLLGSEQSFNDRYRKTNENEDINKRLDGLKRRVAPLILRRTKDQVAKELPPKTEIIHRIELHTAQKDLYETVRAMMNKRVRQAIAARGGNEYQIVFLDALLKLRQICCDPRLLPDDFSQAVQESAKLDHLKELLEVLVEEGRHILIFSQFTTMLELIENHLKQGGTPYLKLTGASKDRGALVEDFQSGKFPVFLISLKAGGTGLNLTAADTVIHYDPWWNPAAEAQATDRAYRIGQDKPVFVHKLLCQNTVEERIHQLQIDKAKLADGLLNEADITHKLGPKMMQDLLEG